MLLFSLTAVGILGRMGHYLLSLVLHVEFAKNETSNSWLLHAMLIYQPLLLLLIFVEWFYSKTWENCFWHWYFIMHGNLVTIAYGRCQWPVKWELSEISEASLGSSPCYLIILPISSLWYLGALFHSDVIFSKY